MCIKKFTILFYFYRRHIHPENYSLIKKKNGKIREISLWLLRSVHNALKLYSRLMHNGFICVYVYWAHPVPYAMMSLLLLFFVSFASLELIYFVIVFFLCILPKIAIVHACFSHNRFICKCAHTHTPDKRCYGPHKITNRFFAFRHFRKQ